METDPRDATTPPQPDEAAIQEWVRRAQAGSEEAFARLMETFAGRLHAIIYRILLDWEETRDVTQEAFIHAHRALSRYRPRARFQSWLFQIGVRRALDAVRRRRRRPEPLSLKTGEGEDPLQHYGSADPALARHEILEAIERAMEELPPEQRTAFVLAEYEGYGSQEIAAVLGGSAKRAEMHLYRARLALRERLKPYLPYS